VSERLVLTRQTLVWALLLGFTIVSWAIGHTHFAWISSGALVLVLAFVKVTFVVREFMEVRHAPLWLKFLTGTWIVVACALLVILYTNAL